MWILYHRKKYRVLKIINGKNSASNNNIVVVTKVMAAKHIHTHSHTKINHLSSHNTLTPHAAIKVEYENAKAKLHLYLFCIF